MNKETSMVLVPSKMDYLSLKVFKVVKEFYFAKKLYAVGMILEELEFEADENYWQAYDLYEVDNEGLPEHGDWAHDKMHDEEGELVDIIYEVRRGFEFMMSSTEKKILTTTNEALDLPMTNIYKFLEFAKAHNAQLLSEYVPTTITDEEVEQKNREQNEMGHPYTCGGPEGVSECKRTKAYKRRQTGEKVDYSRNNEGELKATSEHWVCPCGKYTQPYR